MIDTTDSTEFKYYDVDSKGRMIIKKLYLDPFMDLCNREINPRTVCYRACVPVSMCVHLHAAIRFGTSPVCIGTCYHGTAWRSRGRIKGTARCLPHQPLRNTYVCRLACGYGRRTKRTDESHLIL